MRFNFIFSLSIILALLGCDKKEDSGSKSILNLAKSFSEKKSIQYDIDYRIKFFDYDDTTKLSANCILIREKEDTVFGGYIWYSRKDSLNDFVKYYDLSNLYIIDHNKKEVTLFDLKKYPPSPIINSMDGEIINTYFLKPEKMNQLVSDSSNVVSYSKQNNILNVNVKIQDDSPLSNQNKTIFIDKSKNKIDGITFRAELDNQFQYNQWDLSNVEFNTLTSEDLKIQFAKSTEGYTLINYSPKTEDEMLPLQNGTIAPDFTRNYFINENREFSSTENKDDVLILDFWYRNCYPCVQAIPQLNNVHKKYRKKGVKLIGLNPYDNDSISKSKLVDFVKYHKMEYPIVFVDTSVTNKFKVMAFPTLYIIDKKGKVIFSKVGYGENTEKEVDSVLNSILK